MNLKEIKELVDLITEKGITEFELERAGVRLKISRVGGSGAAEVPAHVPVAAVQTVPVIEVTPTPRPAPASSAPAVPAAAAARDETLHAVRSPMVGTFYAAPGQGSSPFVKVGDRVQAGQVLCIIEAMKLMNEIESEISGIVVACHVENGQPVEYGEQLFDLKPLRS